jgi:AmmeMemoRadiSam system protein A
MGDMLSASDQRCLLILARTAVAAAVRGQPPPDPADPSVSPALRQLGCCFVTLTCGGHLRGCIGGLQPERPLHAEVGLRAAQAALHDPRFVPVQPAELPGLEVEISVLTPPQPLTYSGPADLVRRLRPGVDGVVLHLNERRATFLPQVWERVPEPERFLSLLCDKLGARADAWRRKPLRVETYQVIKFTEAEFGLVPMLDDPVLRPSA